MEIPHLERREEFEEVLKDYHVSLEAQAILAKAHMVLLIAPTAIGRNTIINELVKTGRYHFIITDTTRPPRVNSGILERNGVEYFFRGEDDMLDDLKHGRFVEAAIIHNQQVSGLSVREVEKADKQVKIAITDIEIVGTENVMRAKPSAVAIFVLPPSFDEWLRRLTMRNPTMTTDEMRRRLTSAIKEFTVALNREYYRFIVNDDLQQAVKEVDEIVRLGRTDQVAQNRALALARTLLSQTEEWLAAE